MSGKYEEYILAIDSSIDIYNGNLASFTTLLPTRFKDIEAAQLVDITLPAPGNLTYEFMSIEGFNQLCGPSGGMNFAFCKIVLPDKAANVYVADTNTYNYDYVPLNNPIAALDRLNVKFVDGTGNLVPQAHPCNFQLRILQKKDNSIWGYGDERVENLLDLKDNYAYRRVPRARRTK